MTTEVVVMNKEAVALAADSAVTANIGIQQKIYNSANKLFRLSKSHPVGMMIFNNANYMGIPWEIIIKLYRDKAQNKGLDTLDAYAHDFLSFLEKRSNELIPEEQQRETFRVAIGGYFSLIKDEIDESVTSSIEAGSLDEEKISEIVDETISKHHFRWSQFETCPSFPDGFPDQLLKTYRELIEQTKEAVFQRLPMSASSTGRLHDIAVSIFCKPADGKPFCSGVVFAGFGTNDVFPKCATYQVETFLCDKLAYIHKENHSYRIDFNQPAAVASFAQGDTVRTFMEGAHPSYRSVVREFIRAFFVDEYPSVISDALPLSSSKRQKMRKVLADFGEKKADEFRRLTDDYTNRQYVEPILTAVEILPKDELAAFAEALVNITSIKRRVSMDSETVGGPVDVAVISKKDGFIWIKRKHYFTPEYNHEFFQTTNQMKGGSDE